MVFLPVHDQNRPLPSLCLRRLSISLARMRFVRLQLPDMRLELYSYDPTTLVRAAKSRLQYLQSWLFTT